MTLAAGIHTSLAHAARYRLKRLVQRAGWAGAVGGVLIAAASIGGLLADAHIDEARSELARERARLMRALPGASAHTQESDRTRLARFYTSRFPGESELSARLGQLYAAADAHGVAIQRVDYRRAAEPGTPLLRVSLALPVQGDFTRIHAWLSDLLVQLPELALEGISMKRAGSEASTSDMEIRLALFLEAGR